MTRVAEEIAVARIVRTWRKRAYLLFTIVRIQRTWLDCLNAHRGARTLALIQERRKRTSICNAQRAAMCLQRAVRAVWARALASRRRSAVLCIHRVLSSRSTKLERRSHVTGAQFLPLPTPICESSIVDPAQRFTYYDRLPTASPLSDSGALSDAALADSDAGLHSMLTSCRGGTQVSDYACLLHSMSTSGLATFRPAQSQPRAVSDGQASPGLVPDSMQSKEKPASHATADMPESPRDRTQSCICRQALTPSLAHGNLHSLA